MNTFVFSYLLFCFSLFSTCYSTKFDLLTEFDDDDLQALRDSPTDFQCKSTGLACDCKNLTVVYYCVNVGGKLSPMVYDYCPNPKVCMESSDNGCGDGPNPECGDDSFTMECTSEGMFPHPTDCRKYYVCVKNDSDDQTFEAHPNACFGEFGYDPLSTYCKLPLNNDFSCPKQPIQSCTKATGPQLIASNPYMFYTCEKSPSGTGYQPKMFRCAHQEIAATNQGCISTVGTTTPSTPTQTPTPTPHTTCQKGDRYIPDYTNCLFYYDCTKSMVNPPLKQCPTNYSFNKQILSCQVGLGNCP